MINAMIQLAKNSQEKLPYWARHTQPYLLYIIKDVNESVNQVDQRI